MEKVRRLLGAIAAAWLLAGCGGDRAPDAVPAPGGPAVSRPAELPGDVAGSPLDALKVKNAFMTSGQALRQDDITVAYEKGTVYLRGSVPSRDQKRLAEELAVRAAPGIPVRNELTVVK